MFSIHRFGITILFLFVLTYVSGQYLKLEWYTEDTAFFAGQANEIMMFNPGISQEANLLGMFIPVYPCDLDTLYANSISVTDTVITISIDIPVGICLGLYMLYLSEDFHYNFVAERTYVGVRAKPIVTDPPEDVTVCYGAGVYTDIEVYGSRWLEYQWYHDGTILEGKRYSSLELSSVGIGDTGWYYCLVSNQYGQDSAGFMLEIREVKEEPGLPYGPEKLCMGEGSSSYSLPVDPLIDYYHWSVLPPEAGTASQDGNLTTIEWNPVFAGDARIFAETGLGECAGPNSDSLAVQLVGPTTPPEVCIVGVDELSGYYRIIWNKLPGEYIHSYHIYRESNQAGVYLKLEDVDPGDFSVWVDSTSYPDMLPHSYLITYTDSCGKESEYSVAHRTIHLSANLGTGGENNLVWTPYEGFAFLSYEILRGTHPDTMELLQVVPSNVTSYTDRNQPSKQLFYQITVNRDGACQPSKKGSVDYSLSRSNVIEINTLGFEDRIAGTFRVLPNPSRGSFTVVLDRWSEHESKIIVFDLTGKKVVHRVIQGHSTRIETAGWPAGIYMLKILSGTETGVRRIIIE